MNYLRTALKETYAVKLNEDSEVKGYISDECCSMNLTRMNNHEFKF